MARGTHAGGARRQINPIIPLLGVVVVCGAVFFLVAGAGRGNDSVASTSTTTTTTTIATTTTTTEPPPDPVPVSTIAAPPLDEDAPASYRIVYDVVENALPRVETITVRRPYESLVVSTRDGEMVSGSATSRSALWTYLSDREGWLKIQPELHRASFDQRPLGSMATMLALGLAEQGGTATFAGRQCQVFVTGQPLSSTGAKAPTAEESNEVCIDDNGLVLHESWQLGGSTVIERTATEVTIDPAIDPAMFDPVPPVADAEELEALLSTIAVPADETTIADLVTEITAPPGFVLDATIVRAASPDRGGSSVIEIVRLYSDGADLIELAEITSTLGVQLDSGGAVPVEIEGPETWFAPDFRASAIRSRLSESTFVEIRGTDPAQLVALLRTLTR